MTPLRLNDNTGSVLLVDEQASTMAKEPAVRYERTAARTRLFTPATDERHETSKTWTRDWVSVDCEATSR
jgi:hypothetical protein